MIDISVLYTGLETPSTPHRYGRAITQIDPPEHQRMRQAKSAAERRPIVVWNLTRTCNLRCQHCYTDSANRKYDGELSTEQCKTVLDDLAAFKVPAVLFSGGEPLAQASFVKAMLMKCKENNIHTAVDTSGYVSKASLRQVLPFTDLFLFDLKILDPVKHLKYTDVSNTEILDNLEYLFANNATVRIRIPVIPGITFTAENLDQIAAYLRKFEPHPEVNLLPFHRIGESKYNRYNIKYKMPVQKEPNHEEILKMSSGFRREGIPVKIGG